MVVLDLRNEEEYDFSFDLVAQVVVLEQGRELRENVGRGLQVEKAADNVLLDVGREVWAGRELCE